VCLFGHFALAAAAVWATMVVEGEAGGGVEIGGV
jgi:hypothetical protein